MLPRRAVIALILVQLIALAAAAQNAAEFGRGTGGEVVLTSKGTAPFSGSLELSLSSGGDLFGSRNAPAYGFTAGGTLLEDRLWFFASGSRQEISSTRFAELELPENATAGAIGARVDGHLADGHAFSAFFEAARRPEPAAPMSPTFGAIVPSSFLSLRYTGVVTSNMFFTANVTRSSRTAEPHAPTAFR